MKLKELECRAEELFAEVDELANRLEPALEEFEAHCKHVVNKALRSSLVKEIDSIGEAVLKKVAEKQRELSMFQALSLYEGKEVWIQAISLEENGKKYFSFDAVSMERETAHQIAIEMEREGKKVSASGRGFSETRYTPVEEFKKRTETLKTLILSGKLDNILRMKAGEVVWEIMGYGGKLLPALNNESK